MTFIIERIGEAVILTTELFLNGELKVSRKEAHGKSKQPENLPVFTSRMEKREYYKSVNHFDIRNVLDVKGFLNDIRANWNTYVAQVSQWIQKNPVKRLVVTGIFTVVLGISSITSSAATVIEEYTYQVRSGEKIEAIAAKHGVTAEGILNANGLTSINGKKILLPKVEDRMVIATVLNIRSQPTTESSIIGKYKKGDVVKVVFEEDGWAGILIKGRVCFVSADYLTSKQAVESSPTTKTMYVTATSLRVREAASTSSAIIGSLKLNDRVSMISTSNGWAKMHFNGKIAFVSQTYLTNNEPNKNINDTLNNTGTYVIKSGDTFTKIGKTLGFSVSQIQKLNPGVEPTKMKIGQTIKIPSTTAPTVNQIIITAQIGKVDDNGTFRFITAEGTTYAAKATGNMINELINHQGKKATLTLEGKRGTKLTLVSIQ
ncbi:SH3 domain-containing protein [Bacillus sp. EB106-08-02-XG196]|nr:SH3 domain-containing protein [Bacillus sp. EB106-08-02-XG196]